MGVALEHTPVESFATPSTVQPTSTYTQSSYTR
jgi:hypothetical protein